MVCELVNGSAFDVIMAVFGMVYHSGYVHIVSILCVHSVQIVYISNVLNGPYCNVLKKKKRIQLQNIFTILLFACFVSKTCFLI